jgi:hypothetical protein
LARRRKRAFVRTKSGRPSRAGASGMHDLVDRGTAQLQKRRLALVNGNGDTTLAGSMVGVLFANDVLDQDQMLAAMRYARAHAIMFGRLWSHVQDPLRCLPWGGEPPSDELHAWAENRLDKWNACLSEEQRQAIADVSVFNALPSWYLAQKLKWRPMPEDAPQREALVSGLEALARCMGIRQRTGGTIEAQRSWADTINEAAAVAERKAEAAD